MENEYTSSRDDDVVDEVVVVELDQMFCLAATSHIQQHHCFKKVTGER